MFKVEFFRQSKVCQEIGTYDEHSEAVDKAIEYLCSNGYDNHSFDTRANMRKGLEERDFIVLGYGDYSVSISEVE